MMAAKSSTPGVAAPVERADAPQRREGAADTPAPRRPTRLRLYAAVLAIGAGVVAVAQLSNRATGLAAFVATAILVVAITVLWWCSQAPEGAADVHRRVVSDWDVPSLMAPVTTQVTDGGAPREQASPPTRGAGLALLAWLLAGAGIALLCFSWSAHSGRTAVVLATVMAAAVAVGGLLGFLFGIPRTLQTDLAASAGSARTVDVAAGTSSGAGSGGMGGTASPAPMGGAVGGREAGRAPEIVDYRFNTNLEQISDWLTKILIGVGLIELSSLRTGLAELGQIVATNVGERAPASGAAIGIDATTGVAVLAQALVVLGVVAGFVYGYLWTRLDFGGILAASDIATLRHVRDALPKITAEVAAGTRIALTAQATAQAAIIDAEAGGVARRPGPVPSSPAEPIAPPPAMSSSTATPRAQDRASSGGGAPPTISAPVATSEDSGGQTMAPPPAPPGDASRVATPPQEAHAAPQLRAARESTVDGSEWRPPTHWPADLRNRIAAALSAPASWTTDPNAELFSAYPHATRTRALLAHVTAVPGTDVFVVSLILQRVPGGPPLDGPVVFLVHPTFRRRALVVAAQEQDAVTLSLKAGGAFTAVAIADDGRTVLALDLSLLETAPPAFRMG